MGYRGRVVRTKSYCPATAAVPDEAAAAALATMKADHGRVFVMSGYPVALYNYQRAIAAMAARPNDALAIFVYGTGDGRPALREAAAADPRLHLYEDRTERFFNTVLAGADAMLRITATDSFGIAVADAVSMGVPVLASDVTERFPGARLVPLAGDAVEQAIDAFPDWSDLPMSGGDAEALTFRLSG